MFDQNDQNQPAADATNTPPVTDPATAPVNPMPVADPNLAAAPMSDTMPGAPMPVTEAGPAPTDTPAFNTTSMPVSEDPMMAAPAPVAVPEPATTTPTEPAAAPAPDSDNLLGLKQQALQSLSPLLSQLDQAPEEKFRTTMMMIQASDDQSLIQAAYDAANAITDEKAKAQALLDVVNEINYFTQGKPAAPAS